MDWIPLLQINLPGAQYSIANVGDDQQMYESLVFHDSTVKPLYTVCEEWQVAYDQEQATTEYQKQRRAEYPPLEDLILANWERVVENRPEFSEEVEAKRQAVKKKYPKPV